MKNPSSKCKPMTKLDYCLVMSDDGSIRLAESHEYYAQVQCQMFVTDAKFCGKNKHCIK